ncbi:MAG: hypothetical protein IJ892_09005 [Prevotella sp.]|nr:hypothetical protein [Prevotella sp.]
MKKKLLLMLSFVAAAAVGKAQDTDLSSLTDAVYVQSQSAPAGSQQTLSVCMKNSMSVQTIQFDLYLPEGLSFVANEDGEMMTASKARINKFNYFESSIQTDGALRLLAQATTTNIPVGDGEIATVIVKVDANMELGDYPISVKNIILVNKENESKKVDVVTTTITITEKADTRTVLDENNTEEMVDATGVDVLVKRTIVDGVWKTLCLPFSMTAEQVTTAFGTGVRMAEFTDWEVDGNNVKLTFTEGATAIEKNVPCLIKVTEGLTEFTVDGVDIEPERNSKGKLVDPYVEVKVGRKYGYFTGTYTVTDLPVNSLFLNNDRLWFCTGSNTTKAFRGYFEIDDVEYSAETRLSITVDSEVTGITERNDRHYRHDDGTYDLQGRKVNSKQKGVYIENGKKVVVK